VRITGKHVFSRGVDMTTEEINGLYLSRYYTVKFDDMVAYGEFTNLFDTYRIESVTMTFQLITNPNSAAYTNSDAYVNTTAKNLTNWYPKMWFVRDYDGGSTETISSMKERQGVKCRLLQPNKIVRVKYVPRVRSLIYKTSTTEGFAPKRVRLDMSDVTVPHYGLHVVYDTNGIDVTDTYPFKIAVETRIKFSATGVR
jgi:hypothetical protein